jgi:predicted enzyme related to lactoylglutathione lyase
MRLNLLVLKTRDVERLRGFYSLLGLSFREEKHGEGPTHFSARVGELVFELYPLPASAPQVEDGVRLGFAVAELDAVLRRLEGSGAVVRGARETEWGRRAVLRDPDGRRVEVCQG